MAQLDSTLGTIRDLFRSLCNEHRQTASDKDEIQMLKDQLASAEADAEKAKAANRRIQDMLSELAGQLG